MAQKDTEKKPAAKSANVVQTYDLATLRRYCYDLYGITTSTFDGAFYGAEDRLYSVEEGRDIITKWQKKEVK